MNQFNLGDKVVLTGNCEYNGNVETGNPAYLCHGKFSCSDDERGTVLTVIEVPMTRVVMATEFNNGYPRHVEKNKKMVTVKSQNTGNVYRVDTEWARSFSPSEEDEYQKEVEFLILDSAINDEIMDEIGDDPWMDTFEDYGY